MQWNNGSEIPYVMLFPATLRVTHGSSQKRFSTPEEVRALIDSLPGWQFCGAQSSVCAIWDTFSTTACFSTRAGRSHLVFWTLSSRTVWTSLNRVAQLLEMWVSHFHLILVTPTGRTFLVLLAYYIYAVSSLIVSLQGVCMVNSPCLFWERPSVCSLLYICCYACSV